MADTVMTLLSCCHCFPKGQRAFLGSEGSAYGQSSALLLSTHTSQAPVNQGMGARAKGPGCFPSQPAGLPQMAAPGRQADRVGSHLPADGMGVLAALSLPLGREQTGAGLQDHTPKHQPHPP